MSNNKIGNGGDKKTNKVDYDELDNRVDISRVIKNIEIGNNNINNSKNKDNCFIIMRNIINSANKVTDMVNLIDEIFTNILIYFFDSLLF